MRFQVSSLVRRPPARVFAWWTDYGAPGTVETVGHGIGWSRREVLSAAGDEVVLRETMPLLHIPFLRHRVTLDRPGLRFREETRDRFVAEWTFEPASEGTRVTRVVDVAPGSARFAPLALTRALSQRDLDHHARECERDLPP